MAAAEATRESILADIATTLATIDGTGDYWTAVISIKRVLEVPTNLEIEEKPAILIVPTGAVEQIENQHAYHDVHTMPIGIVGILDRSETDVGTAINRFMKDISIAMIADVTRGGYASMTWKRSQTDQSAYFGRLAVCELEFAIRWHCDGREE